MAIDNDTIYEVLETIVVDVGGKPETVHEGDRILGANVPASLPETSLIVDGSPRWTVQAAKDALEASRL
jgi:hypothetical protein